MESKQTEVHDLLILVDATYSMYNYLEALQQSLPKIIQISQLTDCFQRIGLLAYRDYSESHRTQEGLLEWSGWLHTDASSKDGDIDAATLMQKARRLQPIGGGDYPEATKTGLAKAHQLMRPEATTVVLLYTDAPPHIAVDKSWEDKKSNQCLEKNNLTGATSSKVHNIFGPKLYKVVAPEFADWVSASSTLRNGDKRVQVFSFLDESLASWKCLAGYYSYLSALTHGACFNLTKSDPMSIASTTVDVLLSWMGVEKAGSASVELPANLVRYVNGQSIRKISSEVDEAANDYFWASGARADAENRVSGNTAQVSVTSDVLKSYMPKKRTPLQNFAERYKLDNGYKRLVREQIARLIQSDVTAFSLNPVFGSLWRAACNDREYEMRDMLLNAFSVAVDGIKNQDEKVRMKAWLEGSYDYAAEIAEMVEKVPTEDRFPCVFLDPTLRHTALDGDGRAVADFRRDELLEIGRSCDYRILRRLGKVLTELTYVEKVDDLPTQIADGDVPLIPLSLGSTKQNVQLFRILLHLVVPGTMLASRASAVLAALAIKMGIAPLAGPASELMLIWKGKWNNLENPETWNTSCLSLLVDADRIHKESRHIELLSPDDRTLFEKLIAYKLVEANMQTALVAKVAWTPNKTSMPIGPLVVCRSCEYPRSVTMMAEKSGGLCGICAINDYASPQIKDTYMHRHVTKEDTADTPTIWVECSIRECRAQYVVYNVSELNVRPKCHYCRQSQKAPTIECTTCLNRMIWPREYWTHEMRAKEAGPFQCVSCSHGKQSIVDVETSAQALVKDNGVNWLLEVKNGVLAEPFNKRSLFHVVSQVGPDTFRDNFDILPEQRVPRKLFINGKIVRNFDDLRNQLHGWINRRQAEAISCSLCFSDFHRSKLRPACARRGCTQQICEGCLKSWYGTNAPGHIINPATLSCPFCRRAPAAKTLANYGMGIHAVGNLTKAVEERGTWIYAWCLSCSRAQQHMERSCARGAPPDTNDFVCEPCIDAEVERAQLEEALERADLEEARRQSWGMTRLRDAAKIWAALAKPVKECPGCKVPTQKSAGCNHMTCYCGVHWCWQCGKKFDQGRIYDHMSREHGGYYGVAQGENNDDGDEDDGY